MAALDFELTSDEIDNFLRKFTVDEGSGCWNWTGWCNSFGHGRVDLRGRKFLASHVALTISGKPRPAAPGDNALHGDNCHPRCCNPDHIRWGTLKENSGDRDRLGRRIPASGERHWKAKLNPEIVRAIRSSPLSHVAVARELGIHKAVVGQVRRGETWKHVV